MGVSLHGAPAGVCRPWAGVGVHPGIWGHLGVRRPSLPAGTAPGQAVQDGLQILLVSTDLREVALEALDLQLLQLGLLLQEPQFPLQGPRGTQLQPQTLQCPLGLVQGPGWGSMGV